MKYLIDKLGNEVPCAGGIVGRLQEAFWGRMKYEWLYGQRFLTREQARFAIFEYVKVYL